MLSRRDGIILILLGSLFFFRIYSSSNRFHRKFNHIKKESFFKSILFLLISLGVILLSAFFTVKFAVNFANDIKIPPILIGLTIIAIGTCLPELIFSIKAVRKNHDSLALGDILGTVVTDATVILGLVALISPFSYNPINIYTTGTAMFLAGVFVVSFMKSDKSINKIEGLILIFIYIAFLFIEFFVNNIGLS
jgi:cation:H+ antiporter